MIQIYTERLIIREPRLDDSEQLHKLMSDLDTMYYLQDISTKNIEETRSNLLETISQINKEDRIRYFFSIENKVNHNFIGNVGYTVDSFTSKGKFVGLGYFILPEFHNKGYMTEAVRAVIKHAFIENDVYRISTGCIKDNKASENVMQKCGFIKEAEYKEYVYHDGRYKDRVEYRMLKSDYFVQI